MTSWQIQGGMLSVFRRVLIGISLLLPLTTSATTELVLQLDSSWRNDSNPLRLTENMDTRTALGADKKSDSILATEFRVVLVHPLDSTETRLLFTGQLSNNSYQQLAQLDNTEYAYKGAFEWRSGDLWKGKLFRSQEQQLYDYLNGALTAREMVHRTTGSAEVALRVTPDIEFPLAIKIQRNGYDTPANWMFDSLEHSVDGGLQFRSGMGSNISVGIRSAEVSFPERTAAQVASLDSGYRDTEIYLASDWQYSVLTRLRGRIASMQRAYATLDSRNFSTLTAELRVQHNYSPKTIVNFNLWSNPVGITDNTILYTLTTGTQLEALWRPTDKTSLSLLVTKELQRYQYVNPVQGRSNPELSRVRIGGSATYNVSRDIRMYMNGFRDSSDQGTFGANIAQNMLRIGIEYTFENITGLAQRAGLGMR
jgi:hypothetical protein